MEILIEFAKPTEHPSGNLINYQYFGSILLI